jgi:hypothetical protein
LASAWKLERYTLTAESGKFEITLGSPQLSVSLGADATIEERLSALEEKYKQLNQELIVAREELESEARRLDEVLKEEHRARDEADAEIQEQLEAFSVGGLYLESMGLVWLLLGITFATLPAEMAALWSWIPL